MALKYKLVGEHQVQVPEPKSKDEILFYGEKESYWLRERLLKQFRRIWFDFVPHHTKGYQDATLYDQDDVLISLNKEDSDYIVRTYEQEMKRRKEGVFVNINGEIKWLPGDYYFVLMYCKTKRADKQGDWFDYREFQLEDSLLVHHTDSSPHIDGLFISKPKKTGITNLRWLYILNRVTMTRNSNFGNMNIDIEKASKTFRDHFIYAFNGLPSAFKPQIKTKTEGDGKIVFGKQYRSKKGKIATNDPEEDLASTAMCVSTMPHAFDVDVFNIIWYDEAPKYKQRFGDIYRSNSGATELQDFSVGKKWITSYTPEDSGDSFIDCRQLFFNSELRTITQHSDGRTKSKLINHHIAAYASWSTSFDKFGKCDELGAMRKIIALRDQLKDRPRELQGEIRKYANDKKEAWSTGGAGSVFDNIRLGDLLAGLEIDQRQAPSANYVEGELIWRGNPLWEIGLKNKRPRGVFGDVVFVPLTEEKKERGEQGKFRLYNEIPKSLQNMPLKMGRDEWNNILPPPRFNYTLGGDPTQNAAGSEVIEGSKNAYTVLSRLDERLDTMAGKVASKTLQIRYFGRPEMPNEAYEDLVKLVIYTGALCAIEANVPQMATQLMEEGLGNYMIIKDKEGIFRIWERWMGLYSETDKQYNHLRTTSNSADSKERIEMFVFLMKEYFYKPEDGGKDYGAVFPDEEILHQLMDVDTSDTKTSDLFMCFGYNLFADHIYSAVLESARYKNQYDPALDMQNVFAAFKR